jgi:hypothetical protein
MEIIPTFLYEELINEECIIFAGAGVSTESGPYSKPNFYEIIKSKCKYPVTKGTPAFPDLMQYFCDHIDGGQRNRLIKEIISRIEIFSSPGEINNMTTMFHHALAEIPFFKRIVTTNWDTFFETCLNILVPMVEDRDIAFWDDKKRQVLKIHGCVTRPYTLVATRNDYESCINRNSLIFNKLRDLMASKTFIFVGYSMDDSDFQIIVDEITRSLGKLRKLAYIYDPYASDEKISFWQSKGFVVQKTYGIALLRQIREKLQEDGYLPSEEYLAFLSNEQDRIIDIHINLNQDESAGAFATSMYQDGLLHMLSTVLSGTALGNSNENFEKNLSEVKNTLHRYSKEGNLIEIAYWGGQYEVISRYCNGDKRKIPAYFHPNKLIPTQKYIKGNRR